jgi:lipopolysaccharide transport system ATP-binding protein
MSSDVALRASDLGKAYEIYARPIDRLRQALGGRRRKHFEEFWALRDVSFEARRGECLGIIGRNGSGKSTLLQIACGIIRPSAGSLEVNGRVAAMLELGAGFDPELSGRENVYVAATVLCLSTAEIRARFAAIADFAGIGEFMDRPVKHYSTGMYARLAFAVCAHVDADILIVDEVLAVGDAAFVQKCMRFIRDFMRRGTLLFVSHDTNMVVNLCTQAIWLDGGHVRHGGVPKEVVHHYLASLYEERDTASRFGIGGRAFAKNDEIGAATDAKTGGAAEAARPRRNLSTPALARARSIEIFDFDPNAPWFGDRGASVRDIRLLDAAGRPLTETEGGEDVVLRVECQAAVDLERPIVGFYFKDKLGQELFGDNTYHLYRERPLRVPAGGQFVAEFAFEMPYLRSGDYTINIGLAEGTNEEHVQHHWIDDALRFRVHAITVARGLVGLPLRAITLRILSETPSSEPGTATRHVVSS